MKIKMKDRQGKNVGTNDTQDAWLEFLYHSVPGRLCLKVLTQPFVSKVAGCFMNSVFSTGMISSFVKKNHIKLSDYEKKRYRSYNDFFTRKIKAGKRTIDYNKQSFISPCDSKLMVYPINGKNIFQIKNSYYRIEDLLPEKELAKNYVGGQCLIFRLTVDDYHRYGYVDYGTKEKNVFIPGELHTVNPIALEQYNIYKRNCREYTILHTENFGDVAQIEVGAMMVGKIINHHQEQKFCRGEEKGYFEFGGSTIVLLLEPNQVLIDKDILDNSNFNTETIVKYGEKIGIKA